MAQPSSIMDLMSQKFDPLRWIVEGIVPEGVILVAGKPKSGKSWFALNLMLSAVLARKFLEADAVKCGALYLALEDTPRRMQKRMKILMSAVADLAPQDTFEYACEWPAGSYGAVQLDQYLTAHPTVRIVTIDVMQKIRAVDNSRRNDYEKDYESILPWKRVAEKHRVTLIMVHHTRKAEAEDVFDEISGTLGINGVVDQLVVLRRVHNGEKLATIHMRGRDLEEDFECGVELRNGWWTKVGTARDVQATQARRAVLLALRETKGPMKPTELMEALGKKSLSSVYKLLDRMVEDGYIVKTAEGYVLV